MISLFWCCVNVSLKRVDTVFITVCVKEQREAKVCSKLKPHLCISVI